MTATFVDSAIGDYLRKRLMPVEGVVPHLDGIEMYGSSIPAEQVGGDLFEYINFQQRYDLDARIRRAHHLSVEYLQAHPPDALNHTIVDDHVEWLKGRPDFRPEMETTYRQARSLEQVRVAENLNDLYSTAASCSSMPRAMGSSRRRSRLRCTTRFTRSCCRNSIAMARPLPSCLN